MSDDDGAALGATSLPSGGDEDVRRALTALLIDYRRTPPSFNAAGDHRAIVLTWAAEFALLWIGRSIHLPLMEAVEIAQLIRKHYRRGGDGNPETVRKHLRRIIEQKGTPLDDARKVLARTRADVGGRERDLLLVLDRSEVKYRHVRVAVSLVVEPEDDPPAIGPRLGRKDPIVFLHMSHRRTITVSDYDRRWFAQARSARVLNADKVPFGEEDLEIAKHRAHQILDDAAASLRDHMDPYGAYLGVSGGMERRSQNVEVDLIASPNYEAAVRVTFQLPAGFRIDELSSLIGVTGAEAHVRSIDIAYDGDDHGHLWTSIVSASRRLEPQPVMAGSPFEGGEVAAISGVGPGLSTYRVFRPVRGAFVITFTAGTPEELQSAMRGFPLRAFLVERLGVSFR